MKCGNCCKGKLVKYSWDVRTAGLNGDSEPPDEDWSDYEGFSIFWAQGMWWYFKLGSLGVSKCCAALKDNLCSIWMDETEFHPICRYWPFHPTCLNEFPDCGFGFVKD